MKKSILTLSLIVLPLFVLGAESGASRPSIDGVHFQARKGLATHRTYLGSCHGGLVRVTSYKVPGYAQINEMTMNHRGYAKLYAAVRVDEKKEFVLVDVNGRETHFPFDDVLRYLMQYAPNVHALYVNNMVSGGTDPDILRKKNVVPRGATFPLRSDCNLNENDKLPVEKWEKLPD